MIGVLHHRRLKVVAALVLAAALLLALAVPAQALLFLPTGVIEGHVTDSVSHAALSGIRVDVYTATGGHIETTFTDSTGHYTFTLGTLLGPFTDHVGFTDVTGAHAQTAYSGKVNYLNGTDIVVGTGDDRIANVAMDPAVVLKTTVMRSGHPFTKLSGKLVGATYFESPNAVYWSGMTGGGGSATLSGLPTQSFFMEVVDPLGSFATTTTNVGPYGVGQHAAVVIQMPLANLAKDVTVSVPHANTPQKKNKKFTVTGTMNHRVVAPKTLTILAVKGSTTKSFSVKIKALTSTSTYKGSIKLGKGTWTLYSVFSGSGVWAPTDSVTGKVVKVK